MNMNRLARLLGIALAAATIGAASAQSWPDKPVPVINPFPAGGGVDTFARFQRVEIERWGKVVRDAKIKIDN